MIVARPIQPDEPDLLIGNEFGLLVFTDLFSGAHIKEFLAPPAGWVHGQLETAAEQITRASPHHAWNAWLGNHWIGSSEV